MLAKKVWFTLKEKKWSVGYFGKFFWTGKEECWDENGCTVNFERTLNDKCLIVVRRSRKKRSSFMGKKVTLRYMLGFEILGKPSEPKTDLYIARANIPHKREGPKKRWVLQLDEKHWIWEWAREGEDITNSTTYRLYNELLNELDRPSTKPSNFFDVQVNDQENLVIPIIYQPNVDCLKNFLRELHCAKGIVNRDGSYEIEVSLLFNNERLRQHGILNSIYSALRQVMYGRQMDIESFKILVRADPSSSKFIFEGIYSNEEGMNADSIHGDKPPPSAPERPIKYYFSDNRHPIVFVNTANHAMAEHDTNNRIWKLEYVPWLENAPIKFGCKSRKEVEQSCKM